MWSRLWIETDSEGMNQDFIEEGKNIPFPSKDLDTFKTNTITIYFEKAKNVEQEMVTSPNRMGNLGNYTQKMVTRGDGYQKGKDLGGDHTQQKDANLWE